MDTAIFFSTNDPNAPEKRIVARVSKVVGGAEAQPRSVVFSTALVGEEIVRLVDVVDHTSPPRRVIRVESLDPDRIRVEIIDPKNIKPTITANTDELSTVVVARLKVIICTSQPCQIDGKIAIHLDSSPELLPVYVPVTGNVSLPVTVHPSKLTFPIRSDSGVLYSSICMIRSVRNNPIKVAVVECPKGLAVRMLENTQSETSGLVYIEVSADPTIFQTTEKVTGLVKLVATVGKLSQPIELEILCHPKGEK